MYNYIYFDSEYNKSNEANMNVVCTSFLHNFQMVSFWNNQSAQSYEVLKHLLAIEKPVIVSFAAEAEASALISMGIDPLQFKWIDLQLEVKMLYNHCNLLCTGNHIRDGRKITLRPKTGMYGKILMEKPPVNLASSLLRFLDVSIDTDHKNKMRDIIISGDNGVIEANKEAITKYCESDVTYLPKLLIEIQKWHTKLLPKELLKSMEEEMFTRGEFSARTAMMTRLGTPINMEWAKNLAANVPILLDECIRDINSQFPEIMPFKWDKANSRFAMDTKAIRKWISEQNLKLWPLTAGGIKGKREFSLALEAWEEFFNYRHDFPRQNFGAQMVRYLKLKQTLSSFNFHEGKKSFFDTIGSDGYSRPYTNHYGAQSSRSQPKSTGFLFLKSAWMRVLCQPPKGYTIGAIDYASQEFLIGGIQAQDRKMIEAYATGDVYLAYGKEIKVISENGTKATHGKQRDAQKPVILGWQYWATGYSLSYELTNQTGRKWTPEEAQPLLDRLDMTYSRFAQFREQTVEEYRARKYLRLDDGWTLFGDNPSHRSTANCRTQGMGAVIMRKAVALAQDKGLKVIFSLHDALYIMCREEIIQMELDVLGQCMKEAFIHYFKDKENAALIRLDYKAWGSGFEDKDTEIITPRGNKVSCSKYHVDGRSKSEYNLFGKYFLTNPGIELL